MNGQHGEARASDIPNEEYWRTHASHQNSSTEFPSVSYFQKGEKVWYSPANHNGLLGPYIIVEHKGDETYTIKKEITGEEHEYAVSKSDLLRF